MHHARNCHPLSLPPPSAHTHACKQAGDSTQWRVVPVVSCRRAEYKFRCDASWLLSTCRVDASDLTFLDDVDLVGLGRAWTSAAAAPSPPGADGPAGVGGPPVPLQVTLTDHCALARGLADLGPLVVEILDHHMDVGALPVCAHVKHMCACVSVCKCAQMCERGVRVRP